MTIARRVLVISADILPYPGLPTTGAGLRAWSLGQGLISRGHQVLFSMPETVCQGTLPDGVRQLAWPSGRLYETIQQASPDVVVVCGWSTMNHLRQPIDIPIALDQHGPLLLERQFRKAGTAGANEAEKVSGLSQADFFCCAGEKQRVYFEPWLIKSGFVPHAQNSGVIPVSLSPDLPKHHFDPEITFVYGGVFLPWQDPTLSLDLLIKELEAKQQGRLKFFGGKHPFLKMEQGVFEALQARLQKNPHVEIQPMTPHAQLIEVYRHAHVAIDLMARNPERELAFTTRTVEYLWCGLPVIYNNYAELSDYLREYDAGWTVDPQDTPSIRAVITEILASPMVVARKSGNAQKLVKARLNWEKTIEPLHKFILSPTIRPNKPCLISQKSFLRSPRDILETAQLHYHHGGLSHLMREMTGFIKRGLGQLLK